MEFEPTLSDNNIELKTLMTLAVVAADSDKLNDPSAGIYDEKLSISLSPILTPYIVDSMVAWDDYSIKNSTEVLQTQIT